MVTSVRNALGNATAGRRNLIPLKVAGVPFHGSEELHTEIHRMISSAADRIATMYPKRYNQQLPGAAKRKIMRRIAAEFPGGIHGDELLGWLARQDWRTWK